MLKLYRGENGIRQDAEDIDPDRWLDEGELTEIREAPLGKMERRSIEPSVNQRKPEIPPEPALEIQIVSEDLEEIAVREGIHERIQAEIHHEDKEVEARAEEMLEVPPEWSEVPDLKMEYKEVLLEAQGSTKQKRDEVAQGRRKQHKEDDIQPENCGNSPTVSQRTQNSEGFYSEGWNEVPQEKDEWQAPDKLQRILQMVFRGEDLEINSVGYGSISNSCTQHQGGGCSVAEKAESPTQPLRLDRQRRLA